MIVGVAEGERRPLDVLHVDDDPMNRRVVKDILEAFGHRGFQAASGAEALTQLGAWRFDLVLMDIHMPDMGGIEVVRLLRASLGPERETPVVALTADALTRTLADYIELGFQGFVTKPILVSRLYAAIEQAAISRLIRAADRRIA